MYLRAVGSESSLCAFWTSLDENFNHSDINDSDSNYADAQADLSPSWMNMSEDTFSYVVVHLYV